MTAYSEGTVHGVLMIKGLFLFPIQRCRLGESGSIARCEWGGESPVTFIIHVDCIRGDIKKNFSLCVWDYYFAHNKIYSVFLLHQEGCARMYRATPFTPQAGLELLEVSIYVKSSWTNEPSADCRDVCQRIKMCNMEVFKTWQDKALRNLICFEEGFGLNNL